METRGRLAELGTETAKGALLQAGRSRMCCRRSRQARPVNHHPPAHRAWRRMIAKRTSPIEGAPCRTNPDDAEVVPPMAELKPWRCFLEGRVPPRPIWAEFCKSFEGP